MAGEVMQTVAFDVSRHGLGHLGQMAPVVQNPDRNLCENPRRHTERSS